MKKIFAFILVLTLLVGSLSCFAAAESKPVITVWLETPTASVKNYIESFSSDEYDVEYVYYSSEDLKNQVRIALASGAAPDVTCANTGTFFNEIMEGGYALPLADYAEKYGWYDRVESEYLGNCSYDDTLYGLPLATQCTWGLMFYNADFFKENGIEMPMYPTTAETIAICEKVRELGKQPIAIGNVDLWPGVLLFGDYFVQKAGQELVDQLKSGEVKWNECDVVRECFEELAALGQSGAFTSGYEVQDHSAAIESFVNGTCEIMYMVHGGCSMLRTASTVSTLSLQRLPLPALRAWKWQRKHSSLQTRRLSSTPARRMLITRQTGSISTAPMSAPQPSTPTAPPRRSAPASTQLLR